MELQDFKTLVMSVAKTPKEAEALGVAFDESLRTLKEEVWENAVQAIRDSHIMGMKISANPYSLEDERD